jgi:ABC-type transport system substrate-binding protein
MSAIRRTALAAAAALGATLLAAGQASAAPAQAQANANGTFYYTDLLGGNQQVVNPEIGSCKLVSTLGTSVNNQTDATVVLYTDTSCALLANPVSPGSTITFIFKSYRFVDA